jgi:XXXCH domain-containing protein
MDMKSIKQELRIVFAAILERAKVGELPLESDVILLEKLARRFLTHAADAWIDECDDLVHIAAQLTKCVKRGEVHDAILLVESISDAMNFCHRSYGASYQA